jgi:competence protein ComEC
MGRIGLSFLAGHCCIHLLAGLPDVSYVIVLLIGLLLASNLRSIVLIAFIAGLGWAWGHAAIRLADDLPASLEGRDIVLQGRVASLPAILQQDVRFELDVEESDVQLPRKVLLTWYRAPEVPAVGERWQLLVRLKRRNGFSNPGGFDYEAHLFAHGIGATGYIKADDRTRLLSGAKGYLVTRARAWIAQRMEAALTNTRMLGVLQGLAIGDTRRMTKEQWDVFAASGTTHLMAISGLHITMVAAIAAWLGGSIVRIRRAQARGWTALHGQVVFGTLGAASYSLLAGLSIPTQRTLLMLALYFAARWLRRELPIAQALGLAVCAVLLVDPFAPLSVGAWLSFGAVVAIVVAMSGRLERDSAVIGFARVQLAVTLGLLPLLITAFGSVSLISPLANALAVPLFTIVIVPCVLLGALGSAIAAPIGTLPLEFASWLLEGVWQPLQWLSDQPIALWHFPTPSLPAMLAMLLGAMLLILPGVAPSRVLGAVLCSVPLFSAPRMPELGSFELTVLDVGQGLSTVIRTHSHTAVFDAGPAFQSGRDAAEFAVLPYLHAQGARRIDALIISHSDMDHRGGMDSIVESMRIGRLLVGPSLSPLPAGAMTCVRGETWTWDEVRFEILHPSVDFEGGDNDTSCVLRISAAGGSVLLTGDIEAHAEQWLLRNPIARPDIVVAPHHGSRTSSTEPFVRALSPELAIFSVGYRNRWGLPKPDVVQRWRDVGSGVLSTARSGAIEIYLVPSEPIRIREHRKSARRYWTRGMNFSEAGNALTGG